MGTELESDIRETFPLSTAEGMGDSDPKSSSEIRILFRKWDKILANIAETDTEHEWWNEVTSSFPMLLHTRSKILEKLGAQKEFVRTTTSASETWGSGEASDAVEMWIHAECLIEYTVEEVHGELDVDGDLPERDLETQLPLVNKLLWASTLRDAFGNIIHRYFDGGTSHTFVPDVTRWSMIGFYLMAKTGFYVLRDLGYELTDPPEEDRLTELKRIGVVDELADKVDRALDERVGTFERPVPEYEHLVRRWDKPNDEPYIERSGVRARLVANEVESGESPEDVAANRNLSTEAVHEAVSFFGG